MSVPELEVLLAAAISAATTAGDLILSGTAGITESKGAGDYVTETDRASEDSIRAALGSAIPGIPVVGEEDGGVKADAYWLVDPLDGTTNFMHGFPVVGVSIALINSGEPAAGVVHAPFLGDTYSATKGGGAFVQPRGGTRRAIRVSTRPPKQAVVATGFPFRNKPLIPRHLRAVEQCLQRFEDLRRPGAASLDLAWVAAGVFEGFFELGLSSWDVAAGALLVSEAGGVVTDWNAGPDFLSGNILAGSPRVHAELTAIAKDNPSER